MTPTGRPTDARLQEHLRGDRRLTVEEWAAYAADLSRRLGEGDPQLSEVEELLHTHEMATLAGHLDLEDLDRLLAPPDVSIPVEIRQDMTRFAGTLASEARRLRSISAESHCPEGSWFDRLAALFRPMALVGAGAMAGALLTVTTLDPRGAGSGTLAHHPPIVPTPSPATDPGGPGPGLDPIQIARLPAWDPDHLDFMGLGPTAIKSLTTTSPDPSPRPPPNYEPLCAALAVDPGSDRRDSGHGRGHDQGPGPTSRIPLLYRVSQPAHVLLATFPPDDRPAVLDPRADRQYPLARPGEVHHHLLDLSGQPGAPGPGPTEILLIATSRHLPVLKVRNIPLEGLSPPERLDRVREDVIGWARERGAAVAFARVTVGAGDGRGQGHPGTDPDGEAGGAGPGRGVIEGSREGTRPPR